MELQQIAAQLRQPHGAEGKKIGEVMNEGNKWINLQAIESLQLAAGDTVLEIGMGNGYFAPSIVNRHESIIYTGCDFSELMVTEARQLNKEHGDRILFEVGSADCLPFADEQFSKILTVNTLYFWQPSAELKEIKRVLQQGGCFVLAIRTKEVMEQMPFTQYGFVKYNEPELKSVLEEAGFLIEEIKLLKEPPQEWQGRQLIFENLVAVCTKH